ncbi:MAG: BlaI/MecI/CopY family transcriptional regulator [Firmicutes bacterium]|nr:BlaI/MecI/CopY family transcriptional regulator [Bacillota bacterium]MBR5488503.1 BlaI/MecI/CopY family transcriptional regulator [Bacillota bacterium]
MSTKHITISDAEWAIMKALWEAETSGGLTLRQIADAVADHGWGYSTVRTMVGRLAEKGAIEADRSNPGSFHYYAAVSEEVCRRQEVKSFLNRVFDGSAKLLVSALVEDRGLTKEEEETLLAIIDKME